MPDFLAEIDHTAPSLPPPMNWGTDELGDRCCRTFEQNKAPLMEAYNMASSSSLRENTSTRPSEPRNTEESADLSATGKPVHKLVQENLEREEQGDNSSKASSKRSTYIYSPLRTPGSIRLLRLLPHENEGARIQCQLFDYPLEESVEEPVVWTRLYEALSYVWGSLNKRESISIDECDLPVTTNLHTALSHLRDRFFERIIWIDAVCINQEDLREREQQVQYMAKIYAKAARVIVWLGEAAADSDRALNEILVAANTESTSSGDTDRQPIITLLQRQWFRRIWVLQEVAVARHVLIMCGSTMIDGYAFCLGLQSLNLSYGSYPDLGKLIHSVTYLIRGSIFRPKYTTSPSAKVSLGIRPLGELIEMYHTHESTVRSDKIFALLGMSSDDPGAAGLRPNYKILWDELFKRLVKFLLGGQVSVETWVHRETAVITGKGSVLGKVSSAGADRYDGQQVVVTLSDAARHLGHEMNWILQPSAKSVQVGDLVCFLHGAPKPTIIRLCRDHFIIVMIAATPLRDVGMESTSIGQSEQPTTSFPRDFLLVWDWESSRGRPHQGSENETLITSQVPNHSQTELKLSTTQQGNHSDMLTRLRNVTLILEEAGEAEGLRETMECYERMFGTEHLHMLTLMEKLALICKQKEQWRESEELLEQVVQTRRRVQGGDHADTLSSMNNLTATYRDHGQFAKANLAVGRDGFEEDEEGDHTHITKEGSVPIARSFDEEEIGLVLEKRADISAQVEIFNNAIRVASERGEELVAMMLLEEGVDVNARSGSFGNALPAASAKGKEKIVATLLSKGAGINTQSRIFGNALYTTTTAGHETGVITVMLENEASAATVLTRGDTNLECGAALLWAARNGHEKVVKLLLENGADVNTKAGLGETALRRTKFITTHGSVNAECEMTALLWAARNGYESMVRLLLENKADVAARTCSGETALLSAARQGHEGVVKLLLEYGADVSTKDITGRTALCLAARKGHIAVLQLLLEKELNVGTEAGFGGRALQIDEGGIQTIEINGGFFHLTGFRGRAGLQIERLEMNGGCLHLDRVDGLHIGDLVMNAGVFRSSTSWSVKIRNVDMNGGSLYLKVSSGGAELQIGHVKMNAGSFYSQSSGGGAKVRIGSIEMNGGSFYPQSRGGGAKVQIGSIQMNGGSFYSKPIGASAELQIEEVEMKGGSFRSKAYITKIKSLELSGGSVTPIIRRTTTTRANENGHKVPGELCLRFIDGRTVLYRAAGEEEASPLLENRRLSTDDGLLTALDLAAENGHEAAAQLLLEKGANVNSRWGKLTALRLAADEYHDGMVRLLVENGADVDAEDEATKQFVARAVGRRSRVTQGT